MTTRLGHDLAGPDDAPVLVLGSSLGATRAMWDPQRDALADRFRVLRYEHRGHGQSEESEGPHAVADLAGDVLALLDELGVERMSYAGLSLGGMVGMWLAAHEPRRVDRLVLLCTAAVLDPAPWTTRAETVRRGGMEAVADVVVERWFTPAFAVSHPEVVSSHRSMITSTSATGYAACCDAIGAMDLRPDLGGIAAPTLVIAASDDPATPVEHARSIAGAVPGARLETVGPAAHLANVEQPAHIARLLLEHLSG